MTEIKAALLAGAAQKQRRAADPCASAWVRANAGTGKTHVLVQRILRLLLAGASPRSILCLTYTKNAAAEMEARVLAELGAWATADDAELRERLTRLFDGSPAEADLAAARCLFAAVIDAPGGIAMMTIHSFCERILRRYSLEAGAPPGFSILTEDEAREALHAATAKAFSSSFRRELETLVAHAGEQEFGRVLQAMLSRRGAIAYLLKLSNADDPVLDAAGRLRALFGLSPWDTKEALLRSAAALLDVGMLEVAVQLLSAGSASDLDGATRFRAALVAQGAEERFAALRAAFLTKEGSPRKSLMTAPVKKRAGGVHDALQSAQAAFTQIDEKLCGLKAAEATAALLRLTAAIFEHYEGEKRERAALDFDDLIEKTLSLLYIEDAAEWVLYQLDARIDHILVDEAQDTSPQQWAILERLSSDFFAGASAREGMPTIFAVGDEKQSIYGFQGAAPKLLATNGSFYEAQVQQAGFEWRAVSLDLSFRTLAPILAAVDDVSEGLPGLGDGPLVPHAAFRGGAAGFVELWEPERGEKQEKASAWKPDSDAEAAPKPASVLANRIAEQIKRWLDSGETLPSTSRPIAPGDILILLRKREPMAALLQGALKRQGVPVAGADRVALLDTLAVMDLLALADALLLPEDDLSLAAALKSPLLGLSEDELFRIAYGREGSLWRALEGKAAEGESPFAQAMAKLRAWRALAFSAEPLDFFAHILEAEGGREAFAARLGAQCYDALNELLAAADGFGSRGGGATLSAFVAFLRESASEVKRESDQAAREVRIMTVHGAKGLEANIVILGDACSGGGGRSAPVFFLDDNSGKPELPVWAVKGTSGLPPIAAAKEALKEEENREAARLLYVAMTRARDRLYVAGFHNKAEAPEGSWFEIVRRALLPRLKEAADFAGRKIWRAGEHEEAPRSKAQEPAEAATALPSWIAAPPAPERRLQILSPSRLAPFAAEAKERQSEMPEAGGLRDEARAEGVLIHRLLEILPALAPEYRRQAADLIASAFASELAAERRQDAVRAALALLSKPELAPLFERGLSEAGLARFASGEADGAEAAIIGQADRIVAGDGEILVLDYKSGRLAGEGDAPANYLAQLAAYRAALQSIYPAAKIEAALLNTRTAELSFARSQSYDG